MHAHTSAAETKPLLQEKMDSSRDFYTSTPGGSRDDEEFGTSGDDSFFTPLPWYALLPVNMFFAFVFPFFFYLFIYLFSLCWPSPTRWKKYKRALIIGVSVLGVVLVGLIITAAVVSSRHDSSKHTATGPKNVVRVQPEAALLRSCSRAF